jgi:peptidoglycan/xylan/chitin deacetylase (PgdA/CDA1 family)
MAGWRELGQLRDDGFTIGAHSFSHPHLTALPGAACRDEIVRSRALLQEKLATEISHFAYPFGDFNQDVRSTVMDAGYRSACSVRVAHSNAHDDMFALGRIPVSGTESMLDFAFRLRTARNVREYAAGRFGNLMGRNRESAGVAT